MSKPISIGQSHNVISILTNNVEWSELDAEVLQRVIDNPLESGFQFTMFLMHGARVNIGEPKMLTIDRSKPFNPAEFIGQGWTIEEQDDRALALTEVDLTKVRLETCLKKGESYITGEEKLKRLKQMGNIRLDAGVFMALWENKQLIPESWKGKYVYFDGTVLRNPGGLRYVLCLVWRDGQWHWHCRWLGGGRGVNDPSAVLAS